MSRVGFRLESSRWLMVGVAFVFWILANASLRATFFQQTYRWLGTPSVDGVSLGMSPEDITAELGAAIPCSPYYRRSPCMASYRGLDGERVDVFFTRGVASFVFGWSLYDGPRQVLRAGDDEETMCHVLGSTDKTWLSWLMARPHLLHFVYGGRNLTVNAIRSGILSCQARVASFRLEYPGPTE